MNDVYTPKQRDLMRLWQSGKLKRINLLEGSVRSGKTWISLVLWAFWVATMPKDGNYLMVAKTLTSLRRNCLDLLGELVGTKNWQYSLSRKEGRLFGRLVYLEGVNDVRAESKIRGMTLQGAYCDELTLFTEDFFVMLLSRLSMHQAKVIATTNPDSPGHWLKTKYMDRSARLDMLIDTFLIEDNTFLDAEYVTQLKAEYTGIFYDRFILGKWTMAEGRIYDMFDPNVHTADDENRPYTAWYISMDYGTQNPTAMLLWGKHEGVWYMVDEYYYSGRDNKRQKTDEQYYADLVKFAGDRYIKNVIVDPAAASMIACIQNHKQYRVEGAKNDVINGIRDTATALVTGKIRICKKCKHTLDEINGYVWDDKAAQRGEDKPLKENDHAMDAMRYFVETILSRQKAGTFNRYALGIG